MNDLEAIDRAARLQELGIEIRSAELREKASDFRGFYERGGNRHMRRAAERAKRKRGR